MLPSLTSAVTHHGRFHADDVLAGALLVAAFPAIKIVRTRCEAEIARHPLAFDVGGELDVARLRLDHHFAPGPRRRDGSELSSVGLLFELAGVELLRRAGASPDAVERLALVLEHHVVRVVDAIDTGSLREGFPPTWLYGLTSERPIWDELPENSALAHEAHNAAYMRQVTAVAEGICTLCERSNARVEVQGTVAAFTRHIAAQAQGARGHRRASIARARSRISELLLEHPDPAEPLLLPSAFIPWTHVWHEAERATDRRVDHVIYRELDDHWRVQSASVRDRSTEPRWSFPRAWAGLTGGALAEASGLDDAVFCHPHRFAAAFRSQESARAAARIARASVDGGDRGERP